VTIHTVGWHYIDALASELKNLIIVMTMGISEKMLLMHAVFFKNNSFISNTLLSILIIFG